ncbi:coproporphyrinogen III oxidase [Limnospira fusiformis CCALA 023]|uniref:radical SAM family heme chaperone HemW n=2 Tax=Limnospira platensis TaxID=118562 RepID=UPI00396E9200
MLNESCITHTETPTAAYVHIPFCRRRCYYCDFAVSVVGDRRHGENSGMIQEYVNFLCEEIVNQRHFGLPLKTVFFGGGTPSLLSVQQFDRLMKTISDHLGIASDAEISVEMDPGTFDLGKLQGFVAAGANRVSVGVQAFQDDLLRLCGRSHTVADIWRAIDLINQVGVVNFSIDLISGLPHQTPEMMQESLDQVLSINPAHVSHYDLIVEPQTAFGRYYKPGEFPLPDDQTTANLYRQAQKCLTSRFKHYEISNYARPGFECRHNLVYWHNQPYYGFGMGAASYVGGYRLTRPRTRDRYYQWLRSSGGGGASESWLVSDSADLPPAPTEAIAIILGSDFLLETLMLGLRLASGVDLLRLQQQFGEVAVSQITDILKPYGDRGWVEVVYTEEEPDKPAKRHLRLTDPEGFLFSNTILADLFGHLQISDEV